MAEPLPIDTELCGLVWAVVDEARQSFHKHREEGKYVAEDFRPAEIRQFASGFPNLGRAVGHVKGTIDYAECFGLDGRQSTISFRALRSWPALLTYAERTERLRQSFLVKEVPAADADQRHRDFFDLDVWFIPQEILDRLMRTAGEDFSYEQFLDVYVVKEAGHLRENLAVSMLIPIALTRFESRRRQIGLNVELIELTEAQQLARVRAFGSPASPANETVVGAATHALHLTGWEMPNSMGDPYPPFDRPGWWPLEKVDRFFDALRVVTGLDTGYAQLCLQPAEDWAFSFTRDLPPLILGPEVRRYPERFDNFGWNVEREVVSDKRLEEVASLYADLEKRERLRLPSRRLSSAMLRTSDDDRILDLLIGLEALLGDQSKTEMTYKLAVRAAAVLAAGGDIEPSSIFGNVKQLYSYRSAVAHGDRKRADKRRLMETAQGQVKATIVAENYLRAAIGVLSVRADIGTASDIDSKLVLRSFGRGTNSP
jgi:hypothetical protein